MAADLSSDPVVELVDALALWTAGTGSPEEVVAAAAEAVALGADQAWVIALACLPPRASSSEVGDVLDAHSLDLPRRGSSDGILAGARVVARQVLADERPPRDLAEWVHPIPWNDRSDLLHDLAVLVYWYDEWDEHATGPPTDPDAAVLALARRILDTVA